MKRQFWITVFLPFLAISAMAQPLTDQIDKQFSNITQLVIEGSFCDVSINGNNTQQIEFKGEVYSDAAVKIKYEQSGTTLKVWLDKPKNMIGKNKGKLNFIAPVNTCLSIKTASGSIVTENVGKGSFSFNTASGSIRLSNIGSSLTANTASGSIQASKVNGDVTTGTASGSQTFTDLQGNLVAKAASGSISIKNITGDVNASAASGSINLSGGGNTIKLNTASGSIKASDVNGLLSANTASGGISLERISGTLNISSVSGSQQGTAITLTANANFNSVSGDIRMALTNSTEQLAFNLESVSGSLTAKGTNGARKLQTGNGTIKITGKSVSGSQTYN